MNRKIRLVIGTLLISAVFHFPANAADEYPYGFPTAIMNVENQVPIEILRKLALDDAKKTWGQVIAGPEIPCSNANGKINAYMFVFRIIRDFESSATIKRFESYREIMDGVRQGRRMHETASEKMRILQKGATREELIKTNQQLNLAKMQRWGSDKYGTIVFSSTYDQIPVREKIHGLPYFHSQMDITYEKLKAMVKGNPVLHRICYLSPMSVFYEFHIDGEGIWVNSFTHQISREEPKIYQQAREMTALSNEERTRNRIRWKEREQRVK